MTKQDFANTTMNLRKGDRVRLRLREGFFKAAENFDGSFTGRIFQTGPGLIALAVKREGLRWFTFYPVESITLLAREVAA
ncbi:MAG: hypothetical protein IT174_10610 [Acidobacteria bacterium]|nr:hypothetical protein [Acidobacteriota bacterium]